jgi:hypothetical protein
MDAHWNEGVAHRLKVDERLRAHLVAQQRPDLLTDVVEFIKQDKQAAAVLEKRGRRLYLAYPHFRDGQAGIPDSVYFAEPREARAYPGYREGGVHSLLRRALRKARRMLTSNSKSVTPGGTATAA